MCFQYKATRTARRGAKIGSSLASTLGQATGGARLVIRIRSMTGTCCHLSWIVGTTTGKVEGICTYLLFLLLATRSQVDLHNVIVVLHRKLCRFLRLLFLFIFIPTLKLVLPM